MSDWYYEDSGQSRGPVKESELRTMLADGHLPASTRVWHSSFGQEWQAADRAGFATRGTSTPPPLQQSGPPTLTATPPPAVDTVTRSLSPALRQAGTTSYSSTFANLIAAVPLIIMAFEMVALAAGVSPDEPAFERGGMWWTLILLFFFAYKDAKAVTAAGLNPAQKTMAPFILLTPVGYFLRRRSVTRLPLKPLWYWLGAFAIYVIWTGTLYA